MTHHKFKIGQLVNFAPGRVGVPVSSGKYKVVQLLPFEDGQLQYRVKSSSENFERVAKESQLSRLPG